jgi:tRNA nucleotidyltransferase (CCA-adding enzyme)
MINLKEIISQVKTIVPEVYLVGGSVRDHLLNKEPKDLDFATPYLPEEIESFVRKANKKPYLIGKRFGTIGIKIDGNYIEITTYRTETYEEGNRKPLVNFISNLETDLSRRDFTINAIAMTDTGKLIDPFQGSLDLDKHIIRCVGKASNRFQEDPLRMLRAARFASQLGFYIDAEIIETIKQLNYKILSISKERWVMELDKILLADDVCGLNFLMMAGLLKYIIPELSLQYNFDQRNPYHNLTLWEHTLLTVYYNPCDIEIRWAALLHDIAKPFLQTENKKGYCNYIKHDLLGYEFAHKIATYLKWSNQRTKNVANLVLNHMDDNSPLKEADTKAKGLYK